MSVSHTEEPLSVRIAQLWSLREFPLGMLEQAGTARLSESRKGEDRVLLEHPAGRLTLIERPGLLLAALLPAPWNAYVAGAFGEGPLARWEGPHAVSVGASLLACARAVEELLLPIPQGRVRLEVWGESASAVAQDASVEVHFSRLGAVPRGGALRVVPSFEGGSAEQCWLRVQARLVLLPRPQFLWTLVTAAPRSRSLAFPATAC